MNPCKKCWGTGVQLDHAKLGREARVHRLQAKLKLSEKARAMGISESQLCLLEAGKRGWSEGLFRKAMQ